MKTLVFCVMISVLFVSLKSYSQTSEWINYTNGDKVVAIADGGDCLWIGTCGGGLVRLDKGTDSLAFYNKANAGIPGNYIIALSMDTFGNIWMGTRRNGIGVFDGETCTIYNEENSGLPYNQWNTEIEIDSKQNIWIGSSFWITKFDGTTWNSYETGNPAAAYIAINDIELDNEGAAWIGASWGLGKFDGEELIEYEEVNEGVSSLSIDSDDNLWIGTNGAGLIKFDGERWVRFDTGNSEIPGNRIYCMKFDSEDALWLGTTEGLVKFDGVHWRTYNTDNSELPENVIFSIEIDAQDNIWLGLWHYGLVKFDGTNWKRYKLSNSGINTNIIGIEDEDKKKPTETYLSLGQNSPNPFNANTVISFTLHRTSHVNIAIYNLLGQLVRDLTDRKVAPGVYRVRWDGKDDVEAPVASGIYFYRLAINGEKWTETKKIVLLR